MQAERKSKQVCDFAEAPPIYAGACLPQSGSSRAQKQTSSRFCRGVYLRRGSFPTKVTKKRRTMRYRGRFLDYEPHRVRRFFACCHEQVDCEPKKTMANISYVCSPSVVIPDTQNPHSVRSYEALTSPGTSGKKVIPVSCSISATDLAKRSIRPLVTASVM